LNAKRNERILAKYSAQYDASSDLDLLRTTFKALRWAVQSLLALEALSRREHFTSMAWMTS
jgi:hypothetical protein